jgi:hypothetical protein
MAVVYSVIIFAAWMALLGGQEKEWSLWVFNSLVHYIIPTMVYVKWLFKKKPLKWESPLITMIYLFIYFYFLMPIFNKIATFELYPWLSDFYYFGPILLIFNTCLLHWVNKI